MIGVLEITLISLIFGILLVMVDYYLNKTSKRVEKILTLLPGYNCGACGFGGCQGMAEQIVKNDVDPRKCRAMNDEQYNNLMGHLKK